MLALLTLHPRLTQVNGNAFNLWYSANSCRLLYLEATPLARSIPNFCFHAWQTNGSKSAASKKRSTDSGGLIPAAIRANQLQHLACEAAEIRQGQNRVLDMDAFLGSRNPRTKLSDVPPIISQLLTRLSWSCQNALILYDPQNFSRNSAVSSLMYMMYQQVLYMMYPIAFKNHNITFEARAICSLAAA